MASDVNHIAWWVTCRSHSTAQHCTCYYLAAHSGRTPAHVSTLCRKEKIKKKKLTWLFYTPLAHISLPSPNQLSYPCLRFFHIKNLLLSDSSRVSQLFVPLLLAFSHYLKIRVSQLRTAPCHSLFMRSSYFNACESVPEIFHTVPNCSISWAIAAYSSVRVFVSVQIAFPHWIGAAPVVLWWHPAEGKELAKPLRPPPLAANGRSAILCLLK